MEPIQNSNLSQKIPMKTHFLNRLISAIRYEMGSPVRIAHVLHEHQIRPISLEDPLLPSTNTVQVKAWDQFCPQHHMGPGFVDGWAYSHATKRFERHATWVPGYARLVQTHIVDRWSFDIRDVHGLTHFKSDLPTLQALSKMAVLKGPDPVENASIKAHNHAHEHIGKGDQLHMSDQFVVRLWSPAVHLVNQSSLMHRPAVIHQINGAALRRTLSDYTLYALPQDDAFLNDLHDVMSSLRASYLMHRLPATFGDANAILLPRSDPRSMAVANMFRRCGTASLDEHLSRVAHVGEANAMRMGLSRTDSATESIQAPSTAAYPRQRP